MSNGVRITDKISLATIDHVIGIQTQGSTKVGPIAIAEFEQQLLGGNVGAAIEGAAIGLIRATTLAGLGSGTRVGQPGQVTTGPDKGEYAWSGSVWVFTGELIDPEALSAADASLFASIAAETDARIAAINGLAEDAATADEELFNAIADKLTATLPALSTLLGTAATKAAPDDDDKFPMLDSDSIFGLKLPTWANIKATLKTYFDGLYPVKDGDGNAIVAGLSVTTPSADRDGDRFAMTFYDAAGKVVGGIDYFGRWWFKALATAVDRSRELVSRYTWSVTDMLGRSAIGVRHDGAVEISRLIRADYEPPSAWDGDYDVAHIRRYADRDVALRVDGAFTYEIMRPHGMMAAVIQSLGPMLARFTYGQSTAGFSGDDGGAKYLAAPFPTTVFAFVTYILGYVTDVITPGKLYDIAPMQQPEDWQNDAPGPLISFAVEHCFRERGKTSPGMISWTSWEGGQPLSAFVRGTDNWDNLMAGVDAMAIVAAKYGRAIDCPLIDYVQGESGPTSGYRAALEALAADACGEVKTRLGITTDPKFLISQVNADDTITSPSGFVRDAVRLDQIAAARAGGDIVLAAPMYQTPLVDSIHPTSLGRMVWSEAVAEAYHVYVETGAWTPLWAISAEAVGSTIEITFAVPFGPLAWDEDWVKPVVNKGFVYSADSGSAVITNVQIIARDKVRITLSAAPGTNWKIDYALSNDDVGDGWASGRGQIYSPSPTPSLYHRAGFAAPSHIRHYCVADRIEA